MDRTRLIFAGQLGDIFDDGGPMLLVEARSVFGRHRMHRAKAHVMLSAIRHRAAELGSRVEFHQVDTYAEVIDGRTDLEVIDPTSYEARSFVRSRPIEILPSRGFITTEAEFAVWAGGRKGRLLMEDFYRNTRVRTGLLMEGDAPAGGQWNYDHDNRKSPPKGAVTLGLPEPWWPVEDEIDAEVRVDLDRWQAEGLVDLVGQDEPRRFAVTGAEAQLALDDFVASRLNDFGPFEDATLTGDWTMAHSLLSVPMNLGVLDPRHVVDTVAAEYSAGRAPLASVEGFVRQVMGWRDYVWHLYWHLGEGYRHSNNFLGATVDLPREFVELDAASIEANCLHHAIDGVDRHGWAHHIQRLMIIGNWALQRGYDPVQLDRWFTDMFVDGTPWVMPANVIGMSQHADGGIVATKPYTSGGAYINKMSDHCGGCRFDPKVRLGPKACPFTAGYWAFLDRAAPKLAGNHRMAQPLAGLKRLSDREQVVHQEALRDGL
ncbi:deoxyribodipyrimidine photo-lyase [Salinibacterium xinjiangense]|uniref:Deoxyribodipyrimidine photolyase-related protein n=1 Tax=Salinibacterium xinjiangense TaxID=386302 RepID=A0A2C8ZIR0_9MICO|nr:cryptochrome/photolyase family protein [Salinibacterium xinjiangense]GGK88904.1 deoxyribodipyrimidine photo-lyase [Salinibacterium xinjiangense]SOE64711.1 deoxyribodipyrimidine photolyase-related protein [Salinibacterium xinjiangense]